MLCFSNLTCRMYVINNENFILSSVVRCMPSTGHEESRRGKYESDVIVVSVSVSANFQAGTGIDVNNDAATDLTNQKRQSTKFLHLWGQNEH